MQGGSQTGNGMQKVLEISKIGIFQVVCKPPNYFLSGHSFKDLRIQTLLVLK